MKKKNIKVKNIKKPFFLAFLLVLSFCLSGCYFPDNPSENVKGYDISSFQVVYKNETNEQGFLLENFATNVSTKTKEQFNSENIVASDNITEILKIVTYELALNKNTSDFTVLNNNENLTNYLTSLQEEYKNNALYVGLSLESKNTFSAYVFDNIIIDSQNKQTDKEKIEAIVDEEYTNKLEPCLNSTIVGTSNTNRNMFLLSNSQGFSTIQEQQYQSIIINPNKFGNFVTLVFSLQCNFDLQLEVKITYHNLKNNTSEYDSKVYNINKSTSTSSIMTYYETKEVSKLSTLNSNFDNDIFNNKTNITNNQNNTNYSLADYYPINNQANNVLSTSLNTSILSTDFCQEGFIEITFIPNKNVPFKFGISAFVVD